MLNTGRLFEVFNRIFEYFLFNENLLHFYGFIVIMSIKQCACLHSFFLPAPAMCKNPNYNLSNNVSNIRRWTV